jgi:hypothetical protein
MRFELRAVSLKLTATGLHGLRCILVDEGLDVIN